MKKTIFPCMVILALLLGCKKTEPTDGVFIHTSIEFSVVDADGNDLLDPRTEHSINPADIRIYYLKEGKLEEVYDSRLDDPRNFSIRAPGQYAGPDTGYRMRVIVNSPESITGSSETHIQWGELGRDIIHAEFRGSPSFSVLMVNKVWLNGDAIWDLDKEVSDAHFTLVK